MVSTTSSNAKERDNVLNQAKTAFRAVAGNLTNKILKAEDLRTAICITGRNPSLEQCKIAWNNAEAGEEVDFSEFVQIIQDMPRPSKQELLASFRALDLDGNGYLDSQEFAKLLCTSGKERMNRQEVDAIFQSADTDNDGRLDYEEFCHMMMQTIKKCDKIEPLDFENSHDPMTPESGLSRKSGENNLAAPNPTGNGSNLASDYDTELVFSDLDRPRNASRANGEFHMKNLVNANTLTRQNTVNPADKKGFLGLFGRSKSKENLNNSNFKTKLPLDLVEIRQPAWATQPIVKFPLRSPWTPKKSINTVLLPCFSALCKTVPLCLVVPNSSEICIAIRNLGIAKHQQKSDVSDSMFGDNSDNFTSARERRRESLQRGSNSPANSLPKVVGVLIPDDQPNNLFDQKPVGFTFSKSSDSNSLIWRGDVIAGTYRLYCYNYNMEKPTYNSDVNLLNSLSTNGSFLSVLAKQSLNEIFNLFDLDGDKHLNRDEYELFHKVTSDNQSLTDATWKEIISKLQTSNNRITKNAFMALHQMYLQDDPRLLLNNLVESGVNPISASNFKMNSIKAEISVTSLNYNISELSHYGLNFHNFSLKDLSSLLTNSDSLQRPLSNLPDNICQGSDLLRLSIINANNSEVYVVAKNLNTNLKYNLNVNVGGSRNIKWNDFTDNLGLAAKSSKLLGIANVIDEKSELNFIMSLNNLTVA